jgi:hypothetical protein
MNAEPYALLAAGGNARLCDPAVTTVGDARAC